MRHDSAVSKTAMPYASPAHVAALLWPILRQRIYSPIASLDQAAKVGLATVDHAGKSTRGHLTASYQQAALSGLNAAIA